MNEKKALYIIPEIDKSKETIKINENDEKAFKIDFEKKKNTLKGSKNVDFFDLPKEGETKPVFYIQYGERLYFGFTPRLRLFYDYSIMHGYNQEESDFDYAKSIFGTTFEANDKKTGYKSKVSFSDAVALSGRTEGKEKVVLAEPKPTSYLDYLEQDKYCNTTYNTKDFKLRGVKQYWLHKDCFIPQNVKNNKNDNVKSKINALGKGTIFKGKIRFQNLTEAELGLLLWSICLEKNSWMNIGKAKAYGFGAISVSDVEVKTIQLERAYDLDAELSFNPFKTCDIELLITAYKDESSEKYGQRIDELEHIKDFFDMKNSKLIPDKEKIRYMDIDNSEYQNRKKVLPNISEIIDIKKK